VPYECRDENGNLIATVTVDDLITYKHTIPGWQIVECEVPDDFTPSGYAWGGTQVVAKPHVVDKAAIQAEIDRLEDTSKMNRGIRELSLITMTDLATRKAEMIKAANPEDPRTVSQIRDDELSTTPAYVKFKALNDQIAALRAQL
jgi:hypothetical protein